MPKKSTGSVPSKVWKSASVHQVRVAELTALQQLGWRLLPSSFDAAAKEGEIAKFWGLFNLGRSTYALPFALALSLTASGKKNEFTGKRRNVYLHCGLCWPLLQSLFPCFSRCLHSWIELCCWGLSAETPYGAVLCSWVYWENTFRKSHLQVWHKHEDGNETNSEGFIY